MVKRAMMLVDRANGRGAGLLFCETEDELRQLDEAMNQMNPPPGSAAGPMFEDSARLSVHRGGDLDPHERRA